MDIGTLTQQQRELLSLLLDDEEVEQDSSIWARGEVENAPLSFAQQRIWFLDQMEPGSSAYNIAGPSRIQGALDIEAIRRSLGEIERRHQALRAVFDAVDGAPVQRFTEPRPFHLPVTNLTHFPTAERLGAAQRLCAEQAKEPFDLSRGPLLKAFLYRLAPEDHVMLLVMHHIAADGWSLGVLTAELMALYEAYSRGAPSPLPELEVQYADYAAWQREWMQGETLANQLAYWKRQLGGKLPILELHTDRPRPAVQTFNGSVETIMLAQGMPERLRALSQQHGVTLFMTLLAAFQALLWRYTGEDDLIVGSPIAGRNRAESEKLVGLFLNTLVLRTDLSGNPTFRELLSRVKEMALEAYNHQDVPFEKLVEELHEVRDLSRSPLFQVMFILQVPNRSLVLPGLSFAPAALPLTETKYELTLFLSEHADKLEGVIEFDTDLYEAATIRRMIGHFEQLLEGVLANPDQRLSDLPLLTQSERQRVLVDWNRTAAPLPANLGIHDLFQMQARLAPERVAASFEGSVITYGELDRRSNQLARYLQKAGAGPEILIGICVERSLEMLVALLGVLKAGSAYLPIDPAYPPDRIAYMLEDSAAAMLITEASLLDGLPAAARRLCIDSDWTSIAHESDQLLMSDATPESPAYVIYTSGSTGRPKGVVIEHRAAVNFLYSMKREPGLTSNDVILALTTLSFDIAGLELFLPLTVGARIEIASREVAMDGTRLSALMSAAGITVLQATPATWRMLIDSGWRANRHLKALCGGEALPRDLALALLDRVGELWNMYGPTETTIWSAVERISREDASILIGRPIANTRVYILDAHRNPLPAGTSGELYIAGKGLARGYLHRHELTSERFVPDPFSSEPGARMYRTGDLARFMSDGRIECLGRIDGQVKIRGYRIEVGEVEAALAAQEVIREAVVIVREDEPGNKRLVAYLVVKSGLPSSEDLRRALRHTLPDYMIPSAFVILERLPLTPSGKVDRRALPLPERRQSAKPSVSSPPRTTLEHTIAEIWQEVLNLASVDRNTSFFDLGGHSLLLAKVHSRIQSRLAREIPMMHLFKYPTVSALAEQMNKLDAEPGAPASLPRRTGARRVAMSRYGPASGTSL